MYDAEIVYTDTFGPLYGRLSTWQVSRLAQIMKRAGFEEAVADALVGTCEEGELARGRAEHAQQEIQRLQKESSDRQVVLDELFTRLGITPRQRY